MLRVLQNGVNELRRWIEGRRTMGPKKIEIKDPRDGMVSAQLP